MKTYIGCKVIKAEPMDEVTFLRSVKHQVVEDRETAEGYKVVYPDGYTSWSPRTVFEQAYREIDPAEVALIIED
uniref:Uncharacterized protein n=1 Tax=viral metagenome TaxID=1070528 RepID=A0A6M3L8N6_9ZZZZ